MTPTYRYMNKFISISPLALLLTLPGCSATEATAQETPPIQALTVSVSPVDRTPIRESLTLPGLVFPRETYELGFPMGGVVTQVLVHEGQHVERGQILARLDASAVSAQRDQAASGLQRAERDLHRAESLSASGSLPSATLDDARTGADVARASVTAAGFAVRYSVLRAPAAGVVDLRFTDAGEVTGPGAPIVRVVSEHEGWALRVAVPDRFLGALHEGDTATLALDAGEGSIEGRIVELARIPTPGMGTFDVDITFTTPGLEMRTGLVGRAQIAIGEARTASIPTSAIVDGHDRSAFVFVVEDGVAHRRPVELAFFASDAVVIARGLDGIEGVVSRGADRLSDGDHVIVSALAEAPTAGAQ